MPIKADLIIQETGEVKENQVIYTEEEIQLQRERRQHIKEYFDKVACKTAYYQWLNSLKGDFVMLLYSVNEALDYGISPSNLTRLIYLSTFTSYNNNRLELSDSEIITKSVMEKLLMINTDTFNKFYNEIIEHGILIQREDGYYLNTNLFVKGKLREKNLSKNRIQLYIKGIRELYQRAKPREHKQLAYLFQAIPYININNNTICHNPLELNIDNVKPMTIEEYCDKIGYGVANARRFKTILLKFRFEQMPVFNFVKNCDGEFIFINPYVYYGGNKWDEVAVLGGFTTQKILDEEYQKILELRKKKKGANNG